VKKLNCWEFFGCGREPGGANVKESGVCPITIEERLDGVNGGINGGRSCWGLMELCCDSNRKGPTSQVSSCADCCFRSKVILEEGFNYRGMRQIIEIFDGRQEESSLKYCQTA